MLYISNHSQLTAFVERASESEILAIDTEFMREKSYFPKLCLLQLATTSEVAIVDPFTCGKLDVLAPLMRDENIMKLFHAGSQDIEILLREVGCSPWPLFDTQIAAALLGQSHQVGFGSLVHTMCGVRLKKRDSYTDWAKRPLAESQIRYAADDVVYLPRLYATMRSLLEEKNRLHWLDADFRELADPEKYKIDPDTRYIRLKRVNQLSGKQLAAAKEVAAWREITARKRNIPRKWVMGDEEIVEACRREATNIDELFMVRGVKQHVSTRDARDVVACIKKGMNTPKDKIPQLDNPQHNEPNVDAALDLMQALVRLRAKENEIAMQTLASHGDLSLVARGHAERSEVMKGWRRELVGDELLALLSGKVSMRLCENELVVENNSAPARD